jgi:MSHA biogenesis protein MshJ
MSLKTLAARFDKLQLKERRLVMIAAIGGVLLLGYSLVIEPAQNLAAAQKKQVAQQQTELSTLQTQLGTLRTQAANPDAEMRKQLEDTLRQVAGIESELREFDHLLVAPEKMPALLHALLAKNRGLELVHLKTLPATPLLSPQASAGATAAPASMQAQPAKTAGAKTTPPPGGIYRHGMEITIAGSYADLLRYAEELQHVSPRPLWSAMQLKVVEYPRSELTFTLYTLSLDLPWLAV